MTEEIAELQELVQELTGDITRLEKNADTRWENHDKRIEELEVHTNPIHAMLKAIKILDHRVNILKDASNQHAKVLAAKFPEIKCVHMDESGDIAPERGKTGPN